MGLSDFEYKVSAVVLVYNGEPFLEMCLDSLVNQTLDGLEILLINDASTDNSLDICRKYERDFDNVFVIDKDKNEGLAHSANMGIKMARGEYVILVDNDDFIPSHAYEKLYEKAKSTGSDICLGKANFITNTSQYDMHFLETNVWENERTIDDVSEFPEIFHDAFYWNKIIKRELLLENEIFLPYGMIYADRSFSHRAYVHAARISIIPDCVYQWRIRGDSLSMKKKMLDNYINRIDSYELDIDEITGYYNDYFKILLRRVFIPIKGLLDDKDFEKFLFTRVYDLITRQNRIIDDIYDNDLSNEFNICLYLILKGDKENLRKFLQSDNDSCGVLDENEKSYWKIPQFRNSQFAIPDEFFEIRYLESQFLKINKVKSGKNSIIFEDIRIPKYYQMETGYIIFKGRCREKEVYEDNWASFEIKRGNESDSFNVEIPLDELNHGVYDVFFKSVNKSRINNEFRISKSNISGISNKSGNVEIDYSADDYMRVTRNSKLKILKILKKLRF